MDTSTMKPVTVAWLAENQSWRENNQRAFINVASLGEELLEVASVVDPIPAYISFSNGLHTVWLVDGLALEPLELEGAHLAWLAAPMLDTAPITVSRLNDSVSDIYHFFPRPSKTLSPEAEKLLTDAMQSIFPPTSPADTDHAPDAMVCPQCGANDYWVVWETEMDACFACRQCKHAWVVGDDESDAA